VNKTQTLSAPRSAYVSVCVCVCDGGRGQREPGTNAAWDGRVILAITMRLYVVGKDRMGYERRKKDGTAKIEDQIALNRVLQ
jgi:hypothetical protein